MRINGIITAAKMGLTAPRGQRVPEFMQPASAPPINKQLKQYPVNYPRIYCPGK